MFMEPGLVHRSGVPERRCEARSSRESKPTAGEEVSCWNYNCVMCVDDCLSLEVQGRLGACKEGD